MYTPQTFVPPKQVNGNQHEAAKKKNKRTRNPENWKKEKRKRAILSGQAYLNTKGELVGPKSIGPDCNCKHRCFVNVSDASRSEIFNGYYSLKSYDEQNSYLYGLIRRYEIQRKRKPVSERRTCSYKYYVRVKGREIQVCKKAFANIHGISDKKIRTLCIKHEQNILFPRDNRGRHNNRPKKVTPELVTLIKHHILRKLSGPNVGDFIKTEKNQLGPDVNISKLHKNFLQEYQPDAIDKESDKVIKDFDAKVKSWLYFKVFHEEFNSMDFNTVKRKLSDLRKSLEVSGSIQGKKKGGKHSKNKGKSAALEKEQNVQQGNSQLPISVPQGTMNPLSTAQIGYVGAGQQQPSTFPHNLQLSMLGLQHLNGNPHCPSNPFPASTSQHIPQQALNLQTVGTNLANNQSQMTNNQPLSLNLHSVSGPMSSYYLCFGHVSNFIPLPVSSSNIPSQSHPTSSPHQPSNTVYQTQPNSHQQFVAPTFFQPHTVTPFVTQSDTESTQANIIQGYHATHHTHMY